MKQFYPILLIFFIAACSSNQVIKESEESTSVINQINYNAEEWSLQKFINGSIAEVKGDYKNAIDLFNEALVLNPKPGIFYVVAKNYFRINKLANALQNGQKAVQLEPENIEYLSLLASIYSASNLKDSSASVYKKIISIDSTNASAYFSLAQVYEPNRPKEAITLYKKVIDLIGPEWTVVIKLIDLNERLGNIDESVSFVEELVSLNPADLQLQKILIDAYLKTNKPEKAIKQIDESLTSFPDDFSLIEMKANALITSGKLKDASIEYERLLGRPEISFEDKIKISTSFFLNAEKDSTAMLIAQKFFEKLDKDTTDWQVKAALGEISFWQKKDSSAIKYFKTAAELAEWNSQLVIRLGGLLFDNQKYSDAISFLSGSLQKFPNDFVINLIYGLSLSQTGKHEEAKNILELCVKLNSGDITALSALGFTLSQLKQNDEALNILNKALILDQNNLQVVSQIAIIEEGRKNYTVSDSLYKKAIAIDSTNVLILNNYAYSLSEREIDLDMALRMAKKAIEAEPENSSYLDTIGWIYFKLNDFKRAKEFIEKAVVKEESNATLLDHLGDIYYRLGNQKRAVELWKKALKFDSTKIEIKEKIDKGGL